MKTFQHKSVILTLAIWCLALLGSCEKFTDVEAPISQLPASMVFSTDATATSGIAGIYSRLGSGGFIQAMTPYAGMYSDEVTNYTSGSQTEFANSLLTRTSSPLLNANFWTLGYQYIYYCNAAIAQLDAATSVTPTLKTSLTGEAKFLRAYLYLNMYSLFGNIPLVISTNYEETATLPRSAKADIIKQVITDLNEAVTALPATIETEHIRANQYAALALLARAYLYAGNWALAEQTADKVIGSQKYSLVSDPAKVFLKNSTEAILQFYPTQTNQNTVDGLTFLPATTSETPKYVVTPSLLTAFENGDLRKSAWIQSRTYLGQTYAYPAKYKVINSATYTEYLMVLRLAELYLIRAEARIQQDAIASGIADINIIRKRARPSATTALPNPVPDISTTLSKADALLAVEKERRIELMCENGHRWLDLQRTDRAGAILSALKPTTWNTYGILWPVPEEQLRLNPNLTQNDGYFK